MTEPEETPEALSACTAREPNAQAAGCRIQGTTFRGWFNAVVAAYWLSMFVGTHIPNPEAVIGPEVSDKLLHFAAYFVLMTLLLGRHRLATGRRATRLELCRLLIVVGLYAVADELLQAIPGINRHADVQDALADLAGAGGAVVIAGLLGRICAD
ncbi:MAG: VanZ family protein [Planctomycetota bacterium]|jgi:VanZ family protein